MMGLWPHGTVHRYLHFLTMLRTTKATLYQTYEEGGGQYHGDDTPAAAGRGTNRQLVYTQDDSDEDIDFV